MKNPILKPMLIIIIFYLATVVLAVMIYMEYGLLPALVFVFMSLIIAH